MPIPMNTLRNICLEVTLKPFHDQSTEGLKAVCDTLFRQWLPLIVHGETVDVLLWVSDGSEILDYNRDMEATFEWSRFIGSANPHSDAKDDSIASKPFFYRENPPEYRYRDLKRLIDTLKTSAHEIYGKPLRVGAIFDPGPEFAKSTFKYERHPEICTGNPSAGAGCGKTFIYCAEHLHQDTRSYAGYPSGIPEGTPFGAFLGRQVTCYFQDLGFDFLWLSNGLGFGKDTWGIIGSTFDKKQFSADRGNAVRQGIMEFWREFRRECPDIPLRTRGSNSTTGIDIATDAVPLRDIYSQVSDLEIPPNSPWAAITGDFGLEMAGWMSRVAEVPSGKSYLFRYYIHDPWWAFSPWFHQYQRKAHDLYLPLAMTRLDANGKACSPENLSILTVDNSYGEMPSQVPGEVIPELLSCYATVPDEAGPLVWLYPFDEYHDLAFNQQRYEEVFFGDLFMRDAINLGFPLNTVVSTGNFLSSRQQGANYTKSVIVAPTAAATNPKVLRELEALLAAGGQVLLYGPVTDPALRKLLSQKSAPALEGDLEIKSNGQRSKIRHNALLSGGALDQQTIEADSVSTLATYVQGVEQRTAAVCVARPEWKGGQIIWLRGTNSFVVAPSGFDVFMLDGKEFYYPENLMREVLQKFGYTIDFAKPSPQQLNPRLNFRRHANALYLSAYSPDMTVGVKLRMPEGAPVFMPTETMIEKGITSYHLGKAANLECRVFVEQEKGLLTCQDREPRAPRLKRKVQVTGLDHATLRFRPETGFEHTTTFLRESDSAVLSPTVRTDFAGTVLELRDLSGSVQIFW